MNKNNLADVTFLIPVRIDSVDRSENINLIIKFIKDHFTTTIKLLEADNVEKLFNPLIDKKIFIFDNDTLFHHTRYRNDLARNIETPFIIFWDTDIIISPVQIVQAVTLLRKKESEFIIPYTGEVYKIDSFLKQIFCKNNSASYLQNNIKKMQLMYGAFSVGGIFICRLDDFWIAGGENENFYGWGPEDIERVKRWEILGYSITFLKGPIFHLHHVRLQTSWYGSPEIELHNKKELIKICSKSSEELKDYINEWNWIQH
jgi:predicted glycosyltransferase involved in capsule biosynthesis